MSSLETSRPRPLSRGVRGAHLDGIEGFVGRRGGGTVFAEVGCVKKRSDPRAAGHCDPPRAPSPSAAAHPPKEEAASMNVVFTQEQHDAAVEWLEKHREELGLAKERNAERRADARRLHEETGGFGYFPGSERRMKKFSDVSDSEDDADVDDLDESELDRERRRVNDEFKEVRPHRASRSIETSLV